MIFLGMVHHLLNGALESSTPTLNLEFRGNPLLGRIFTDNAGSIRRAFTETLIDYRNRSSQLFREEFPGAGRGSHGNHASVSRGVRDAARCAPACLTTIPYGRLRLIRAKYLVTEIIGTPLRLISRDRTGTDDLL